jgi:hypothetical protein
MLVGLGLPLNNNPLPKDEKSTAEEQWKAIRSKPSLSAVEAAATVEDTASTFMIIFPALVITLLNTIRGKLTFYRDESPKGKVKWQLRERHGKRTTKRILSRFWPRSSAHLELGLSYRVPISVQ